MMKLETELHKTRYEESKESKKRKAEKIADRKDVTKEIVVSNEDDCENPIRKKFCLTTDVVQKDGERIDMALN